MATRRRRRRGSAGAVAAVAPTEPLIGPALASKELAERVIGSTLLGREDPHPSKILAAQNEIGLRLGELYQRMPEKDLDLFGLLEKRRKPVTSADRVIRPRDESPAARKAADLCRAALAEVKNFHTNIAHQWGGIPNGIAFDEIIWHQPTTGALAGKVVPLEIIDRPMNRFLFRKGELFVRRVVGDPVRAPWGRFLCFRHGTKDNPWGSALLDRVYWHYWMKLHGWKYFAVSIEKWAQPTAVAKYKRKAGDVEGVNDASIAQALDAIDAIQTEYGFAIPDDIVVDLLQAQQGGGAPTYENFIALCNAAMARGILGEVDTSGLGKGAGSFAKSKVSESSSLVPTFKEDSHELSAHLTDNLLAPIVLVNLGPDAPVPVLEIDSTDQKDRETLREGVELLLKNGEPVTRAHIYRVAAAPMPREGEPVVIRSPSETERTTA